ncbi:small monomeric GTPase [Entamoeba marina]
MEQTYLKIFMYGKNNVGKTTICVRKAFNQYFENYEPIMEDSFRFITQLHNDQIFVELLDGNDNDQYNIMLQSTSSEFAFVLVYSVIDRDSFDTLDVIYEQIPKNNFNKYRFAPLCIVGNKIDLEEQRVVDETEGRELANNWDAEFIECSAKTGYCIDELFDILVGICCEKINVDFFPAKKNRNVGCFLC